MDRSGTRGRLSPFVGVMSHTEGSNQAGVLQEGKRAEGSNAASVWRDAGWKHEARSWNGFPLQAGAEEQEAGEEYIAGLAREIAQSTTHLQLSNNSMSTGVFNVVEATPSWETNSSSSAVSRKLVSEALNSTSSTWGSSQQVLLSTSPQSTLAAATSWDLYSAGAASSNSGGVSSPPTPVEASACLAGRKDEAEDSLDLLYAELLRLKMEDEIKVRQQQLAQFKHQQHFQSLLWKMRSREDASLGNRTFEALKTAQSVAQAQSMRTANPAVPSSSSDSSYRVKPRCNYDSNQNGGRSHVVSSLDAGAYMRPPNNCSKPRPPAHGERSSSRSPNHLGPTTHSANAFQHTKALSTNGSGMRAVFLGLPGARESGGTGVFLPRRAGGGCHEPKRKPACSTVLLPSRIVQALNLNVADTLACSASPLPFSLRRDASSHGPARLRSKVTGSTFEGAAGDIQLEWGGHAAAAAACPSLQEVAPDVCLPTEWTY